MSRSSVDAEVLRALACRAHIFRLIEAAQAKGQHVTVTTLLATMDAEPPGTFTRADYAWVRTTLGKRLG